MPVQAQLFITCLADQFFPDVLKKMTLIFEKLGVAVSFPAKQTCCGQPFFNSGFQSPARDLARHWLEVFGASEAYIVAPSGSCADFARHHLPNLFPADSRDHAHARDRAARTYEFAQFLTDVLHVTDLGARFPHRVTYHASCHLLRGLNVRTAPKQLLSAVRDLQFAPSPDEETCCGFGGAFSVMFPEVSAAMLAAKLKNVEASGADVVVACDPGCLMHINGGLTKNNSRVRARHLIEVLANE
ncbi:MAG: (Fe-S)-binding protein [Chloroflexi bacterium]|nr:(Fe-S)-binding protein [Chloroflexota bacterium]